MTVLNKKPNISPSGLKKKLGLGRMDKIDIKYMSEVEDIVKVKINVEGDHIYESNKSYTRSCKLILKDEHYTVDFENTKTKQLFKSYSFKNKPTKLIVMNDKYYYDGEEKKKVQSTLNSIMIDCDAIHMKTDKKNLEKEYAKVKKNLNELADLHMGCDLFRFKTFRNVALRLFHYYTPLLKQPEPIGQLEGIWLSDAFSGGMMYAEKGYKGYGIEYDINAMYPTYMQSNNFSFPICKGEFKKINEMTEILSPGIYYCTIEKGHPYFRYNRKNKYFHHDIVSARMLGLNIELKTDCKYNFLYYEKKKQIVGRDAFSKFFEQFDIIKTDNEDVKKYAKTISRCIWGALCQRNKKDMNIKNFDMEHDIGEYGDITHCIPTEDGIKITYENTRKPFMYDYARLGVALLSYSRYKMTSHIHKHTDKIVYMHTDGVVAKEKLNLPISDKKGDFKIENEGTVDIKSIGNKHFIDCK